MKRLLKIVTAVAMSVCLVLPLNVSVQAAGTDIVYVAPTGNKYHKQNCRTLSRSKSLRQLTIDQALASGYTACKVCSPGGSDSSTVAPSTSTTTAAAQAALVATAPAVSTPTSTPTITAEQAVQRAYALYVQGGLDSNSAMTHVQGILSQLAAAPDTYAQLVQNDLAQLASTAAVSAKPTAEQLVQQLYAQLITQGFSSDQAMVQINAQLPAILAQAAS